ncbi:maestro heat-like repeat-containing protein family member 7 [Aptenodytes patagonicus]|uniref:maestro heat-like repeat-containing protein family member 7 n=1 Tax=Aptenodytes patagonicus TaxID=9234 RepID=UPI003F9F9B41
METLQDANTDVRMKALVSSQVRELSISFFQDVMKTVVGRNVKKMKKKVQRVLLPLFLHMNDQIESVAKASGNTLLACAKFLGWRKLSYLAETRQTHLIGECLLLHNRSRVEEYLCQSLPYLKDAQATLRVAAIRFIGDLAPGLPRGT